MMSFDKYQQLPFKFLSRGFIDKVSLKKEILLYIPIKRNCFYIKLLIIVEGNRMQNQFSVDPVSLLRYVHRRQALRVLFRVNK